MRLRAANRNHRRVERRRVQALTEGGGFLIPADFLIELRAPTGPFVESMRKVEAAFEDMRRFTIEEIAKIFRVSPDLVRRRYGPGDVIEGGFRVIDDDEVVAIPHFAGFDGDEDEDEE